MPVIPRTTRDPVTGQSKTEYIDTATGLPAAPQASGANQGNLSLEQLGIDPLKEPEKPQNTSQEILQDALPQVGEKEPGGFASPNKAGLRDQSNNYGYYDKPGWMGFTSMAPGMLGLAGKAVNAATNLNNVESVKAAQRTMAVPEIGPMGTAKGVVKDNKGFVGDYSINNQNYSVGLEAVDPVGRTTLTPNEARTRGLLTGGITPTPKAEVKQARKGFAQEFPDAKPKGILGNAMNSIGDFLGSFFGDDDADGFPDAPDSPEGARYGDRGGFASDADRERGRGISEKASSDIDAGRGGLF